MAPSPSIATASWRLRGLLLCNAAYYIFNWLDSDAMGAFFRSIVHCDSGIAPVSRYAPDWSGSVHCTDKEVVIARATAFSGWVTMITYVVRTPCLLVVGAFADRYGRKKAALLSFMGWVILGGFMFLAATDLVSESDKWTVILVGVGVSNIFNAWIPVSQAMAADMSEDDSVEARHVNMSALSLTQFAGTIVGFGIGYGMLRLVLESYLMVWLLFTCVCAMVSIACIFLLKETLRNTQSNVRSPILVTVWRDLRQGLTIVFQDTFLVGFMFIYVLICISMAGGVYIVTPYQMVVLDYTQSFASLASVLQQFPDIFGVYLGVWLQTRGIEPYSIVAIGFSTGVIGWVILGLAGLSSYVFTSVMFWIGFIVLGISIGLTLPAIGAILSARVSEENQAKVQAVMGAAVTVSQGIGGWIWTTMLFNAHARGFLAGLPFLLAAAVCAVALIMYVCMLRVFGNHGSSGTGSRDESRKVHFTANATIDCNMQAAPLDTSIAE